MGNARILREAAARAGLRVYGGVNAPYIWVKTPAGLTSWQMFDRMLQRFERGHHAGSGFGRAGRRFLSHLGLQQPRERRGSRAPAANASRKPLDIWLLSIASRARVTFRRLEKESARSYQNLPQLYRFCFLMTGDAAKAQEAFQATVREAALRAARGEPPPESLLVFSRRALALSGGERSRVAAGSRSRWRNMKSIRLAPRASRASWIRTARRLDFGRAGAATQRARFLLSG